MGSVTSGRRKSEISVGDCVGKVVGWGMNGDIGSDIVHLHVRNDQLLAKTPTIRQNTISLVPSIEQSPFTLFKGCRHMNHSCLFTNYTSVSSAAHVGKYKRRGSLTSSPPHPSHPTNSYFHCNKLPIIKRLEYVYRMADAYERELAR